MKKLLALLLLFGIAGCASIEEMNKNISSLEGMKIDRAITALGIGNPTSSITLEYEKIYIWESSGNMSMPVGGYNYGYDQFGYQVQTYDPNQSSTNIPLKCKITIYTSNDFRITNAVVEGDGIQCNAYDEKLKRFALYSERRKSINEASNRSNEVIEVIGVSNRSNNEVSNRSNNEVIEEFLKQEKKYKQQYQMYTDTVDDPIPYKDWRNKTKQKAKR